MHACMHAWKWKWMKGLEREREGNSFWQLLPYAKMAKRQRGSRSERDSLPVRSHQHLAHFQSNRLFSCTCRRVRPPPRKAKAWCVVFNFNSVHAGRCMRACPMPIVLLQPAADAHLHSSVLAFPCRLLMVSQLQIHTCICSKLNWTPNNLMRLSINYELVDM